MKRLITDKQLRQKLGSCSEMTIWRLRQNGKLPKPKKLGNRSVTPEDEAGKAIAALVGANFTDVGPPFHRKAGRRFTSVAQRARVIVPRL